MAIEGEYAPSPQKWVRDQVEAYEGSNGQQGTTLYGLPVVVLTTIGAKTGKVRKVPLMRVEHDGIYAVVASQGGAPKNPVWYYNLKANPELELRDGAVTRLVKAREVFGTAYELWWERAVAAYPPYAEYQQRTERKIPVFALEPVD